MIKVVYGCWVVAPELFEGGVVEDVAVCGVGGEEVEGRVTCAHDCDQAGYHDRAVEMGQPATGAERFEVLEDGGEG